MRKKVSYTPLYYLLFALPVVAIIFLVSLEIRDKKLESVNDRIRNLEELVTARQVYRNVIYTEVKENLIVDKRSLFTINYIVTAGSDLSGGVSIKSSESGLVLTYPYPEILSIDADEGSIDEYFALERFGKLKQSDYLNIVFDEKDRIHREALESRILERADRNLQNLIKGILSEAGMTEVSFRSDRNGEADS